jgi:hypothetical protein
MRGIITGYGSWKKHLFYRLLAPAAGGLLFKKVRCRILQLRSHQAEQNDLFRLTCALEAAKDMGWFYRLLSDREWSGRYAVTINAGVNGIYALRASLDTAFDDDGRQVRPLLVRLTGNVESMMTVFNTCGWQAEADITQPHQYLLTAIFL